MAKKKKKLISLKCSACQRINYTYWDEKASEQKKYCSWERKHTLHKEVKNK